MNKHIDPFLKISEIESRTGMKRKTLRRWWDANPEKFPKPIKYSDRLYWRTSWIEAWEEQIDNCRIGGAKNA